MDPRELQERYQHYSVAFAIQLTNATDLELNHIGTDIQYGQVDLVDPNRPATLSTGNNGNNNHNDGNSGPMNSNDLELQECPLNGQKIASRTKTVIIGRNTSFRIPTGSSGVHVWRIGHTHYYLIVGWSGPRNFYTHSNTLMLGITNGKPVQLEDKGLAGLFNHLYQFPEDQLSSAGWFTRVTCHYNQGTQEGQLTTNKFLLGAQVEQEHKSWNTVCLRVADEHVPRDQFQAWFATQKAGVKLLAHRRSNLSAINPTEEEQNHLALVIEFRHKKTQRDDSVWLCELSGTPQSKRDIRLSDVSRVNCELVSKGDLTQTRRPLHLRVYNLGEIQTNVPDIQYHCQRIESNRALGLNERCRDWIMELAARLNMPNREVIPQALEIPVEGHMSDEMGVNILGANGPIDSMPMPANAMDSLRFLSPSSLLQHEKLKSLSSHL
ncbi:hypothetical protein TCAL_12502 [Tigriopus californicus]|uniref:Uncharacterized protein n=1 Tax=Tigriopus californicus TaxID=6832 RepID=A0A553NBP1_TIGCA|nr:uncharacterized protein LOC131887875 [Tigriopus californicus]TRY62863.1 hypothetical protein TCAL_12502 [Tigriopus californicus]|eukprot:TCALIF_12502-PA protein Name:"Protein of unknown function" AED:0.00 eAED:0.00 QI:28/1/1/1/1/1/4/76/436